MTAQYAERPDRVRRGEFCVRARGTRRENE